MVHMYGGVYVMYVMYILLYYIIQQLFLLRMDINQLAC